MDIQPLGILIPLSEIKASYTNPRKRFNEADLQELAESIKQHGVMQPILVRPFKQNQPPLNPAPDDYGIKYQIVAGERRWRASKLAGVELIPAIIRDLDNLETLQLQIIENLQRSDLHPLEEAQGFKALLDNKDAKSWNADELAAKIGKSRSYIYGALKLNDLCTYAQDKFLDGDFGREIALLIARISGAKLQEQAAKMIIKSEYSYRAAKDYIRFNFTKDLSTAPWDKISITLYPAAGSCLSCEKRSGNYPELYPDIESADVCTDTACFAAKKVAYAKEIIDTNPRAIHGEQSKQIMPFGVGAYIQGGFTTSPGDVYIDGFRADQILSDDDAPEPYILVDDKNETRKIYAREEIETLMKQKLEEKIASGEIVIEPENPRQLSEWEVKQQARQKLQAEEEERRLNIFNRLAVQINPDHSQTILQLAIKVIAENASADFEPILKLYNFEGSDDNFFKQFTAVDKKPFELIKIIALLALIPGIETGYRWESQEDNDENYLRLIQFIGDIGLDVSQFLTTELPLPPIPAAQAQESSQNPASAADIKPALPEKLQAIKDKELAKRERRTKGKEQKVSANADA